MLFCVLVFREKKGFQCIVMLFLKSMHNDYIQFVRKARKTYATNLKFTGFWWTTRRMRALETFIASYLRVGKSGKGKKDYLWVREVA